MDSGLPWADQWDYNSDPPPNNEDDKKKKKKEDGSKTNIGKAILAFKWMKLGKKSDKNLLAIPTKNLTEVILRDFTGKLRNILYVTMEEKVEIIARDIIKPSSPTPNDKRILNLSLLDILSSPMYTGALLFYAADPQNLLGFSTEETSLKLKKSLSHTLPIFYPLAGRIMGSFVECNDEGALFIEARVDHLLLEFLKYSVPESLEPLVPVEARSREAVTWPVLLIQAYFFRCGGLVITICTSHKITDATSLAMFIRGWAESSRDLGITLIPSFTASEFFPLPIDELPSKPMNRKVVLEEMNCVTKRFVFDASNIKKLRAKASSNLVKNPTRVEAVTALFWRCATKASRLSSPTPRTSVLQILVNLRGKVNSLCENTIGNMLSLMILNNEEAKIERIQDVVDELRRAKEVFSLNCKEMSESSSKIFELLEEIGKVHGRGTEVDLWISNSWCKLGMYEADFGWGKPVWVTGRGTSNFKNLMLLIDTKDGEGIEAWITLTEEHMSLFKCDQELLESASLNPPVLI